MQKTRKCDNYLRKKMRYKEKPLLNKGFRADCFFIIIIDNDGEDQGHLVFRSLRNQR